jgi:hypothetical protein
LISLFRTLQSSLMQILKIFGAIKSAYFEFPCSSSFWNIWIIIKPRMPRQTTLVSEPWRPGHEPGAKTTAAAAISAHSPLHCAHRRPPPRTSIKSAHGQKPLPFRFLRTMPPPCSVAVDGPPLLWASLVCHNHPRAVTGYQGPALSVNTICFTCCRELTIARHLRPRCRTTSTSTSFPTSPCSFPNHELTATTTRRPPHWWATSADARYREPPMSVSFLTALCPQCVPRGPVMLPYCTSPADSPTAGRNRPAEPCWQNGGIDPVLRSVGRKVLVGRATS